MTSVVKSKQNKQKQNYPNKKIEQILPEGRGGGGGHPFSNSYRTIHIYIHVHLRGGGGGRACLFDPHPDLPMGMNILLLTR